MILNIYVYRERHDRYKSWGGNVDFMGYWK